MLVKRMQMIIWFSLLVLSLNHTHTDLIISFVLLDVTQIIEFIIFMFKSKWQMIMYLPNYLLI